MKCLLAITILLFANLVLSQTVSTIKIAEGVFVTAETTSFITSEHEIDTCLDDAGYAYICHIDGDIWYGGGEEPYTPINKFEKLKISIRQLHIRLDISNMYNVSVEGIIYVDQFKWKVENDIYSLYAKFSDGVGAYSVQWKIEKGKSVRTFIASDTGEFWNEIAE